jgi:hypothetical protein
MNKPRRVLALTAIAALTAFGYPAAAGAASRVPASTASSTPHIRGIDCGLARNLCTEVSNSDDVFGRYVGHDEPSLLFDSTTAGSGNQMRYSGILPTEPTPTNVPGKHSYDFELFPTIWFGMAICDTQSYPNTVKSCVPDSDANVAPAGSPFHPGTAFMELQFYPPGYVQQFDGFSCSATQWCVAMTIDSLSENALTGKALNNTCANTVGLEYVNFAYLTKSGKSQGPANPIQFDPVGSGKPDPGKVAFLNGGDHYTLTIHDTANGVQTTVNDTTNGVVGSMTASKANGFGQVKFAPTGTSCTNLPYDFHPMYSTSTPATTVPWAAATYNVAIDTEIGHFDYCTKIDPKTGSCSGKEGVDSNQGPADADDNACFPGSASTLIKITGCLDSNLGYDGPSYLRDWPDGSAQTPSPAIFTSPKTGKNYDQQYQQLAFNTDLPAIEQALTPTCNSDTGAGCTLIPPTDEGTPAAFYPYYSTGHALGGCAFTVGQDVPGFSTNDFGKNAQYGSLLKVTYATPGGGTESQFNDFQQILKNNPCPAP